MHQSPVSSPSGQTRLLLMVTTVTAAQTGAAYLSFIEATLLRAEHPRSTTMTKFFCLTLACLMFSPMILAALHQAAQMTA
jgi:hypothetical protein